VTAYLDVGRSLIEIYKFIYAIIKHLRAFSVLVSCEFEGTSIEAPIHGSITKATYKVYKLNKNYVETIREYNSATVFASWAHRFNHHLDTQSYCYFRTKRII
jgi:hypothetical protein